MTAVVGRTGERAGSVLLALLPALLAALAEGAWVAVVAALLSAAVHQPASFVVVETVVAALAGLAAARLLGNRPDWPILAVWLTFGAAIVGWLADGTTLAALGRLDPGGVLGAHAAGWFAGLAFLRGSAHARAVSSEGAMETLLRVALPALAIPLLAGGVLSEPWHGRFVDDVRPAVILFLGAATIGVGVARLAALRGTAGFDWRGNRAWLALLVLLVVGVSLLALPIATVLGPLVQLLLGLLFLPVLALGTIAGFRQLSRGTVVAYVLIWVVMLVVLTAVNNAPKPESSQTPAGAIGPDTAANAATVNLIFGIAALVVIALGIVVLARLWSRDVLSRSSDDVPEERWIDTSEPVLAPSPARRGPGIRRRRGPPATAEEAYLAALEVLGRSPDTRRSAAESPREHAARVRRAAAAVDAVIADAAAADGGAVDAARADGRRLARRPSAGLALDLLAADYELARFGGVELSGTEVRRAIGRWRRLRGNQ